MTRIQEWITLGGPVAAVSGDGRKFAAVEWHGDLARNLNVYSLVLYEDLSVESETHGPSRILAIRDYAGDPDESYASPFDQVTFSTDGKTIAFLSPDDRNIPQVYSVNLETRAVGQLTTQSSPVRSFVLGPAGELVAFSAVRDDPEWKENSRRLQDDGVFLWDRTLFQPVLGRFNRTMSAVMATTNHGQVRDYFRVTAAGPELIFSSIQSRPTTLANLKDPDVANSPTKELHEEVTIHHWATMTGDRQGRYLLLFPYGLTEHPMNSERWKYYRSARMNAYARRVAAPYGLVDLATGRIKRLIDAPHPQFERGRGGGGPIWSPHGTSVAIFTLDPIEGEQSQQRQAMDQQPHWAEVTIRTHDMKTIPVPEGWQVISWNEGKPDSLILQTGNRIGRMERMSNGSWGHLLDLRLVDSFSSRYQFATNGQIVLGVMESTNKPPELASVDIVKGKIRIITTLNPELRSSLTGTVEQFSWSTSGQEDSGFLLKPYKFDPNKRYPLVILFDDHNLPEDGTPFIFDGVNQLSGYAARTLAAAGFLVLYAREPRSLDSLTEKAAEGERVREMVESAISSLDHQGVIDPHRVGISGFSRAAYYVDYVLIHSQFPFAAASQIDGGTVEYDEGLRPFWDQELKKIHTPLLLESHGLPSLALMSSMADRLESLNKPNDILYLAAAPHDLRRPQHRLRSLEVHLDWWRFWLKDEEPADQSKTEQYARWHKLLELQRNAGHSAETTPLK